MEQNSLLCTAPGFSSHLPQPRKVPHWSFRLTACTELFKREHSPLQRVPANHESGDKTAIASHSLPGNPWPNPTHSRKSCRRAWCCCSSPQSRATGCQGGQEPPAHTQVEGSSSQILFQAISHCRECCHSAENKALMVHEQFTPV